MHSREIVERLANLEPYQLEEALESLTNDEFKFVKKCIYTEACEGIFSKEYVTVGSFVDCDVDRTTAMKYMKALNKFLIMKDVANKKYNVNSTSFGTEDIRFGYSGEWISDLINKYKRVGLPPINDFVKELTTAYEQWEKNMQTAVAVAGTAALIGGAAYAGSKANTNYPNSAYYRY